MNSACSKSLAQWFNLIKGVNNFYLEAGDLLHALGGGGGVHGDEGCLPAGEGLLHRAEVQEGVLAQVEPSPVAALPRLGTGGGGVGARRPGDWRCACYTCSHFFPHACLLPKLFLFSL